MKTHDKVDVVIVGAGASGSVYAALLAPIFIAHKSGHGGSNGEARTCKHRGQIVSGIILTQGKATAGQPSTISAFGHAYTPKTCKCKAYMAVVMIGLYLTQT